MSKIQCISPIDGSVYVESDNLEEVDTFQRIEKTRNRQKI